MLDVAPCAWKDNCVPATDTVNETGRGARMRECELPFLLGLYCNFTCQRGGQQRHKYSPVVLLLAVTSQSRLLSHEAALVRDVERRARARKHPFTQLPHPPPSQERGCSKAYVARVEGVFPDTGTDLPPLAMAAAGAGGDGPEAAGPGSAGDHAGGGDDGDGGACGVSLSGPPSGGTPLLVDVPLGWDAKTNHATPVPEGEGGGVLELLYLCAHKPHALQCLLK